MNRVIVAVAVLVLLAGCAALPRIGGTRRGGAGGTVDQAGVPRLAMRADGLHWRARLTFLPALGGQDALLYTVELHYLARTRPDRYRVTVSLPYAAQVCRREGAFSGSEVAGPWTSAVGPGGAGDASEAGLPSEAGAPPEDGSAPSEPAGAPVLIRPPACRLELDDLPVADGFALVRDNPLTLQVEWQTDKDIHVEILTARPAAASR